MDPDPKPNESLSNYSTFANNPILYIDSKGDTIGVNWFPIRTFGETLWQGIKYFATGEGMILHKVANSYIKDRCNDGHFAVFSHGRAIRIKASDKAGNITYIYEASGFDKLVESSILEWKKAKDREGTVLTFYSCDVGSSEDKINGVKQAVKENIAQKISKAHPNIIVEAPNGSVVYGIDKNGKQTILRIDNQEGNGTFILYKKGIAIGTRDLNGKITYYDKTKNG